MREWIKQTLRKVYTRCSTPSGNTRPTRFSATDKIVSTKMTNAFHQSPSTLSLLVDDGSNNNKTRKDVFSSGWNSRYKGTATFQSIRHSMKSLITKLVVVTLSARENMGSPCLKFFFYNTGRLF